MSDGGVRETERRHSASCRAQEGTRQREAEILQAGFERGRQRTESGWSEARARLEALVTAWEQKVERWSGYADAELRQGEVRACINDLMTLLKSTPDTPVTREAELLAAILAFLTKWDAVLPHLASAFALQQVRSGVGYSGPTIDVEVNALRRALDPPKETL